MAEIVINGKVFHAKPLWDEWLLNTDFTSGKNPYLHEYFIDGISVSKDEFEKEYQTALSKAE